MRNLEVTIPWKYHAKQRPRHGKSGHTFTPKATKEAEKIIAANFLEAVGHDFAPFTGPISMSVEMDKQRLHIVIEELPERDTKGMLTGDVDNYLKTVGDALNAVAYADDKQIRKLTGEKA